MVLALLIEYQAKIKQFKTSLLQPAASGTTQTHFDYLTGWQVLQHCMQMYRIREKQVTLHVHCSWGTFFQQNEVEWKSVHEGLWIGVLSQVYSDFVPVQHFTSGHEAFWSYLKFYLKSLHTESSERGPGDVPPILARWPIQENSLLVRRGKERC